MRKSRSVSLRVLGAVASLVAVGIVWACSSGGGAGSDGGAGRNCPGCTGANLACCDVGGIDQCLDVAVDVRHCGGCEMACDPLKANKCEGGACKCGFGAACGEGTTCCANELGTAQCADTQTHADHCGACGHACAEGETCQDGRCTCNGVTCGMNERCCGGTCIDITSTNAHCGGCGMACAAGQQCVGGQCTCVTDEGCATQGTRCCDGKCVNVCQDRMNCGACGHVCPPGLFGCVFGACPDEEDAGSPPEECFPF